jgi:hypothetical protein
MSWLELASPGSTKPAIAHPWGLVTLRQGLADEFGNRHAKGPRLLLDESVLLFVEPDLGANHVITPHPMPRSSIRSSGAPQVRQMREWQSPQSSGSGTGLAQAGQ